MESYFDPETVEQTIALYSRITRTPNRRTRGHDTVKSQPIQRDIRTQIHQDIRRIFSSRLETTTDDDGCLLVRLATSSSGQIGRYQPKRDDWYKQPQQPKGKAAWAQKGGDYLHFSIYKENKDTMEVISYLAKVLKLRPQLFKFAGTKDRRGVTVQRASVYRVGVERMIEVGRSLRNAKIGNFEVRLLANVYSSPVIHYMGTLIDSASFERGAVYCSFSGPKSLISISATVSSSGATAGRFDW